MVGALVPGVTVCTPHHGSPHPDRCLKNPARHLGGLKLMDLPGLDVRAVSDLAAESQARCNECVPDHPKVTCDSISAARPWHHVPLFLLHSHKLIYDREKDNDRLVFRRQRPLA